MMATRAEANRARTTHGQAPRGNVSRLYRAWQAMRSRCNDPNNIGWKYYGGKGIRVCEEWNSFAKFAEDMGPMPTPLHSIDRKDNALGYCKSNCKWATKLEQDNNRTSNRRFTYAGRTQNVRQWANETGLSYHALHRRLCLAGWPVERALTTPLRVSRSSISKSDL